MNQFKIFLLLLLILCTSGIKVNAQGFSYVYIQGDKKTPIYTKVEGVMMPRYGKNYALLSRLAPGPLNIEVLFQQNEFPSVQFNILVPENGKRAFVLQKKEEGFSLYDVEQNFYLKSNNDISDDHLPTVISNANIAKEKVAEVKSEISKNATKEEPVPQKAIPETIPEIVKTDTPKVTSNLTSEVETSKEIPDIEPTKIDSIIVPVTDTGKPKFIENITFDNSTNNTAENNEPPIKNTSSGNPENKADANLAIINSDCKSQISAINYTRLLNSANAKKTENERLGLILDATKQNCMSCEQAQKLIKILDSDIAKFSAIKSIYPKITDQSNFRNLESLLSDEEWKVYFQDLIRSRQ